MYTPIGYRGRKLPERVSRLLEVLDYEHGFACKATPGGKTITVSRDGVRYGYVKSYVLGRHGALGYHLRPLGVEANYCLLARVSVLRRRFCERYCCDRSDVVIYELSGSNKGHALFIIKHPELALDVLLREAGLPYFTDQFEFHEPLAAETKLRTSSRKVYRGNHSVRRRARIRAAGSCEWCGAQGFRTHDGGIYLEIHHITSLSKGGEDSELNVAMLCPNHHREAHHGANRDTIAEELKARVAEKYGFHGVRPKV